MSKLLLMVLLITLSEGKEEETQIEKIIKDLEETKQQLKDTIQDLKDTKQILNNVVSEKNPPFIFGCGAQNDWITTHAEVITYSSLLYFSTNVEGANLDIETGVFTAGHPGTYLVTWSMETENTIGKTPAYIYLRKNGDMIGGSRTASYYTGGAGAMYE